MASINRFQNYKFQAHRQGQPLNSSAKTIVLNVFHKLKEQEPKKSYNELISITSELTGVSSRSIGRMQREFRETGKLSTLGQTRPSRAGKSTKLAKPCQTASNEELDDPPRASQGNKDPYENRKAEKVLGQRKNGRKNFILVKWKGIKAPEFVEKKNLSKEILDLYEIFLNEELGELHFKPLTNNEIERSIKIEPPSNITDYTWTQLNIAEEMEKSHPETNCRLDVKLEL